MTQRRATPNGADSRPWSASRPPAERRVVRVTRRPCSPPQPPSLMDLVIGCYVENVPSRLAADTCGGLDIDTLA